MAARTNVLVTGDARPFGALYQQKVHGVLVLSPADALAYVLQKAG